MVCIKKQPYIYFVRLTIKNRHFFRYLTCLLDRGHINAQMKIEPTNHTRLLTDTVLTLFRKKYTSGAVRGIAVNYSGFVDESYALISLFDDVEATEKEENLQRTIDHIRDQFGFLAIQKGTALLDSSRNIARSKLIGGHSAGGLEGLQ